MNRIIRTIAIAAVSAATISATAQETPRWIRKNAISPDGTKVAFCYQGDIFTVSSEGGRALQVTSSPAYDSDPFWTPDGKSLVFSSTRLGSRDIFITSAEGGTPKRITDYPGNEVPMAVLDGGKVIFSADIQQDTAYAGFPENAQLWQIGIEGGRPLPVTSLPVSSISINKDGEAIYEDYKGYEDALRKHHTSSVTRDIWLFKPSDAKKDRFRMGGDDSFTKLSSFIGEDRNPVFAPDGKSFYFISERSGTLNVHKASTTVPGEDIQVTSFKENPVRHLSVSGNGILCFSWNGDLYTMKEGAEPVRLDITLARDNDEKEVEFLNLANASSMAVSPSGKEIAVVIRGDVFVTSEEFKTTNRITNTPEQERNVCFSKDGRTLYYSSERNGHWGIWASTLSNKEDKCFTYAKAFDEKLVTTEGETCFQPIVSPDGKWIAFLRNRTELVIRDLKDGKEKSLLKDVNYSYSDGDLRFQWSPDSKYLLTDYMGEGRWNNCDIALIDIESGKITDLTLSGYSDGNFKWVLDGYAMVWESDKNGYRSHGSWGSEGDVYIMFFDSKKMAEFYRSKEDNAIAKMMEESGDKSPKQAEKEARKEQKDSVRQAEKPAKLVLDLEGREYRTRRLTGISSRLGDFHLTKDGEKLFYVSQLEKTSDLCMLDIKTGDVKVVKKGVRGSITPSADGKNLYMLDAERDIYISADGKTWQNMAKAAPVKRLLTASRQALYALAANGGIMASEDNGATWTTETLDGTADALPELDINAVTVTSRYNADLDIIYLIGNRDNAEDATCVVWTKVVDNQNATATQSWMYQPFTSETWHHAPALKALSVVPYADGLLMAGGEGRGKCDEEAQQKVWFSRDGGLNWWTDSRLFLPGNMACSKTEMTMTADKYGCIWIVCGGTGEVWRGYMSQYTWQ